MDSVTGLSGHNIAYSGYRMRMGLDRIRFAMEHAQGQAEVDPVSKLTCPTSPKAESKTITP